MTEKKKNGSGGKTRREFLKDASLLVGGTAIGSTVLLAACGGGETTETVTTTVGATTVTETVTESKFVCPVDSMEFDTLAELQVHFEATHPEGAPGVITLNVNGTQHMLANIKTTDTLMRVLRERLGLTAAKDGCDRGACGACTVITGGRAVVSCMILAVEAEGMDITTLEGLSDGIALSPVQQLFYDNDCFQCGYCTPGFVMAAQALLGNTPKPTVDQVREAVSGHICVCANVLRTVETISKGVS